MIRFIHIVIVMCLALKTMAQVDTVCAGSINTVYAVDDHEGATYFWTLTGGVIVAGNGTAKIIVNWSKYPGMHTMQVVEQNALMCSGDPVIRKIYIKGNNYQSSSPYQACVNDSVTLTASGGMWYQWSNGASDSIIKIKLSKDTLMKVIISDTVCGFRSDTAQLHIEAIAKPISGYTTTDEEVFLNKYVRFHYSGGVTDQVRWSIQKSSVGNSSSHALQTIFIDTGEAVIQLIAINSFGCADTLTDEINVKDEQLFFPSAFTPNGDGLNDIYKPGSTNISSYQLYIFNRWGQQVFTSNSIQDGWDGFIDGIPALDDVYVYQCEAMGKSGKRFAMNGSITLYR